MNKLNENHEARFRSVSGIMNETNMSRNTVMKIAGEAQALLRYGTRIVRIDVERFFDYLQA